MNDAQRRLLQTAKVSDWLAGYARQDKKLLNIETYTYSQNVTNIGPTASGQGIIQVQADSDFALVEMSGAAINHATGAYVSTPNIITQVTDSGSGKTFFSQFTLFPLVFGLAGFPYMLPSPRIIAPNTNIVIDVNNQDAAITFDVYYSFFGVRLYYAG